MIRIVLPPHLRTLAQVGSEVMLDVAAPVTQQAIIDSLELRYPMLKGTIRDHTSQKRRPFLRFFGCNKDLSLDAVDAPLPDLIATGVEPFIIVGAVAGG